MNVTTDKVYKNNEWIWGYRENEPLDGYDPYSNSKSCSELVTHSYINSFFGENGETAPVAVSTARAGNVLGSFDFAKDRIVPDCIRSVENGSTMIIRNPKSTRPYQHVLEPLFTYLTIAAEQEQNHSFAGFYNVGPDDCDCITTGGIVKLFDKCWNSSVPEGLNPFHAEINHDSNALHEANFLKLDTSLVKSTFGWKPTWHIDECMEKIVEGTKVLLQSNLSGDSNQVRAKKINDVLEKQIREFLL